MSIKQRKKDHVELTASGEVSYRQPTGFSEYRFRHNALPEINYNEVETEITFFGRPFSFPLFISCMTGGYTEAGAVNAIIAEFCETKNLPFGVGSQRIMLEDSGAVDSFAVVREKAPTAFISANIGGAQLINSLPAKSLKLLVESIQADAVTVHLNPLQELMQPEGDRNFSGIEKGIAHLVADSPVPVIVKETGAGINGEVARRLLDAGVAAIDVAGAGGTSWSKVENLRESNSDPEHSFDDWGLPTVVCLEEVRKLKQDYAFELVASGGIRSGLDIAKAMCLGANCAAAAQPVVKAIKEEGRAGLEELYRRWTRQLKTVLTLTGLKKVEELSAEHLTAKSYSE